MKIIFSDIDGPLATDECSATTEHTKWHPRLYRFNPKCVQVLNDVITLTECELVVSSDWRLSFSLTELQEIFEWNGVCKKPIGVTSMQIPYGQNIVMNRVHQILLSVMEMKPEKWVAIDDLLLGKEYHTKGIDYHVFCDNIEGLAGTNVNDKLMKYLS